MSNLPLGLPGVSRRCRLAPPRCQWRTYPGLQAVVGADPKIGSAGTKPQVDARDEVGVRLVAQPHLTCEPRKQHRLGAAMEPVGLTIVAVVIVDVVAVAAPLRIVHSDARRV